MTEEEQLLEGTPALFYTLFWQTREMGFLKQILNQCKVFDKFKVLFFAEDYKPGALIVLDGKVGNFKIFSIDSYQGVEYDAAIIGKIGPIIKYLEGKIILRLLWHLIARKSLLKKKRRLIKFVKITLRCAI